MRAIIYILLLLNLVSCTTEQNGNHAAFTEIIDAAGRTVMIPDSIHNVIALGPGALRLVCYLNATDKTIAIEGNEKKRNVPYLYANPGLRDLPVVGAGNLAEPELLAAYDPDIIVTTYFTKGEADELQQKTGIPVVVIDYADFNSNREKFYHSLRLLGIMLHRENRADSLIGFMQKNITALKMRSENSNSKREKVYIGGIAYRGAHGITSTEPDYAPFTLLNLTNAAAELEEVTSSPKAWLENAFIDIEQLIKWNPDIIFLDAAGADLWKEDLHRESLKSSLKAVKTRELYVVLPHNWYTINYENILCNAWFTGKIMYPDAFDDIEIREKANEIYTMFLGIPVYDSMMNKFDAYKKYKVE